MPKTFFRGMDTFSLIKMLRSTWANWTLMFNVAFQFAQKKKKTLILFSDILYLHNWVFYFKCHVLDVWTR